METRDGKIFKKYKSARNAVSRCQESGRPYSRTFTSAVYNVKLGDQRHVVAVAYMMSDTLMLRHVVAVVYMTSDMLMLRSDVVVRR